MKIKNLMSSTLLSILVLLFSQSSLGAKEILLTIADNNKTCTLAVGDTVRVVLEGNPTTGYTWEQISTENKNLRQIDSFYASSSNRCGAGGLFTFVFSAISPGKCELQLSYRRPWEQNTPPIKTFHSTLIIK
jgi:inhibitor of cysteine peptidase